MSVALRFLVVTIGVVSATSALGQMYSPGYGSYGAPMSNFLSSSYLVQGVANGAVRSGTGKPTAGVAPAAPRPARPADLSFDGTDEPIAPRKLAASYPSNMRGQTEKFFGEVLQNYHKLEKMLGVPRNDLAGAVAAFIAGSYTAYRDQPVPDEYFAPLRRQMHDALVNAPEMHRADDAEKQEMYEQLAILGTYMALVQQGLKSKPDPALAAKTRDAARNYLQQFMKVDPQRLEITSTGLVIR